MKKVLLLLLIAISSISAVVGREPLTPEEIIERFASKEAEFSAVWQKYTYRQNILFEVLDALGNPREQKDIQLEVYFTNDGKRETRIIHDRGHLQSFMITQEDLADAIHHQPFVLTTEELPLLQDQIQGRGTGG